MPKTAMSVDASSALALPSGAEHRRSGMWICFGGKCRCNILLVRSLARRGCVLRGLLIWLKPVAKGVCGCHARFVECEMVYEVERMELKRWVAFSKATFPF